MKTTTGMATAWVAAAMLALAYPAGAQGVYKWVDADGKVHYGQQPPAAEKSTESVKMRSASGFGGNNNPSDAGGGSGSSSGKVEYNADGTKKIPKGVEELRDGLVKGLKKVDPKTEPLSCATAVENIRGQVDQMLEVGQKNAKDGYITQSEYESTAAKLRQARSEVSLGDCEGSSGNKRSFYQCMSSNRNHVMGCGSKFKF